MEVAKAELKERLKVYRSLDDQLREVNKVVYDLREKRKMVEFEMADILKSPALAQVGELRLENDNSYVRVQRPYFENAGPTANRADCFDFIVRQQKANAVETTDFKFTRNIPSENVESE